jgi:hypothetical protein
VIELAGEQPENNSRYTMPIEGAPLLYAGR